MFFLFFNHVQVLFAFVSDFLSFFWKIILPVSWPMTLDFTSREILNNDAPKFKLDFSLNDNNYDFYDIF